MQIKYFCDSPDYTQMNEVIQLNYLLSSIHKVDDLTTEPSFFEFLTTVMKTQSTLFRIYKEIVYILDYY